MSRQTLLQNEFATVWFDAERNLVHHQFHRFIAGAAFREVLTKGLETFEKESATKWLSDDRENSALPLDDEKWAQTEWFPRMVKAGWKYWAIVLPQKIVGQLNMNRHGKFFADQGLTVNYFTDPEAALRWLEGL